MLTIEFKISNCITLKGKDIWGVGGEFWSFQIPKPSHCLLTSQFKWIAVLKSGEISKASGPQVHDMQNCLLDSRPINYVQGLPQLCYRTEFLRQGCQSDNLGWWGCAGLDKLHVIGWEHSKMAIWAISSPPALIYHLYPGDDFVRIERDLCVISWRKGTESCEHQQSYCQTINYLSIITLTTL